MVAIPGFKIDVQKTVDRVKQIADAVEKVASYDVLVGVPAEKAGRRDGAPFNNAELAYIHNFGSPAHRIPPRPFMTQGVRKAQKQVTPLFRQAALDALVGKDPLPQYRKIGMIARNAMVSEITDPEPPFRPLKPATIRARLRKTGAGRRQLKRLQQNSKTSGVPMASILSDWATSPTADSGPFIHPLIDTGQLRASLSFVVRQWLKL